MTIAAAIILLASAVALVVAASQPQLFPIWMRREVDTLGLVRERLGVWLLNSRLFLASAIGTAVGAGLLFGGVDGPGAPLAATALLLLAIGTALWCVNVTFRVSTTAAAARDFTDTPPWYPYLVRLSVAVWETAAIFLGLTLIGIGLLIVLFGVLPAWSGWTTLAVAAVQFGTLVVTRDAPPLLFYSMPAVWGVAALMA
jgi:hypothetical protein